MIILAYENNERSLEISYTWGEICARLGLTDFRFIPYKQLKSPDSNTILVSYGFKPPPVEQPSHLHIQESSFFKKVYPQCSRLPIPGKFKVGSNEYPDLFPTGMPVWTIDRKNSKSYKAGVDILAMIFFCLSRCEEQGSEIKDVHGRFPAAGSLAYKEGFLDRPLVDELVILLSQWLREIGFYHTFPKPWGASRFCLCLTHDVDRLFKYDRSRLWSGLWDDLFRNKDPFDAWDRLSSLVKGDPYDTFEDLLSLTKGKSCYYFFGGKDSPLDGKYHLNEDSVRRLLARLSNQTELGLHGSYNSGIKFQLLKNEKRSLENTLGVRLKGVRQHYLRIEVPLTWRYQYEAGFGYDTSLGYPEIPGFRAGTCVPFQVFDIVKRERIDLYEIPLIAMDASLFGYMNLTPAEGKEVLQQLIEQVESIGGIFTLLWHNCGLDSQRLPGWRKVLKEIVNFCMSREAILLSPGEALDNWSTWTTKATRG